MLSSAGQTARRSHDRKPGLGAWPAVRVCARAFGLALGPVACAAKSNAIPALPALRRRVDRPGAVLTSDARGTQTAIAAPILEGQAEEVLAWKGNQETPPPAVIDASAERSPNDCAGVKARRPPTRETRPGRDAPRRPLPLPVPPSLPGRELGSGLQSIGRVASPCVRAGQETVAVRDSLRSLGVGGKRCAHAVRSHGGRDNRGHGSLDRTDREEESRIRDPNPREHWAWLKRVTRARWKHHPGRERVARTRRGGGWSDGFLLEVLTEATL